LTDLAEKEANEFAKKMDRLLETYNPVELEKPDLLAGANPKPRSRARGGKE
jgi:hypothetical protein